MRGASVLLAAASGLLIPSISAKCTYNEPNVEDSVINAWIAGCGQEPEVARCFAEGLKSMELYNCLVASGCDDEQAAFVQPWFDNNCEEVQSSNGELRLRQAGRRAAAAEAKAEAESPKATAAAAAATTEPKPTTPAPITTNAPYATIFARATATSETTSLVCLTTSLIPTSKCFQPNTDSPSTTCTPTTEATIKCNAGLLCQSGDDGGMNCMVMQNTPILSGIIVSACLGAFFAGLFGTVTFMSCRSRVATRKAQKLRDAELDAKSLGATAAMASEVYAPLIQEQAPGAFAAGGYGDKGNSRLSPSASYQDMSSMRSVSPMRKPVVGLGEEGFGDARNPMNPDDNDIGYGRQR